MNENHNENQCDKCLEEVGKKNLFQLPFLYMDKNDEAHPDQTKIFHDRKRKELLVIHSDERVVEALIKTHYDMDWGYRQYYVCAQCLEDQPDSGKYENE